MPPMSNICRHRHLTRSGDEIPLDCTHGLMVLGTGCPYTKYLRNTAEEGQLGPPSNTQLGPPLGKGRTSADGDEPVQVPLARADDCADLGTGMGIAGFGSQHVGNGS
jgi:hypothetical protein